MHQYPKARAHRPAPSVEHLSRESKLLALIDFASTRGGTHLIVITITGDFIDVMETKPSTTWCTDRLVSGGSGTRAIVRLWNGTKLAQEIELSSSSTL
jgi:hypothetical protein